MIDPNFSMFVGAFDKEEAKKIARSISLILKDLVKKEYEQEGGLEERLSKFFSEVCRTTGEMRDYGSEQSHEHLVNNWRKGSSTVLAIASYYYILSNNKYRNIARRINLELYGVSDLVLAKGITIKFDDASKNYSDTFGEVSNLTILSDGDCDIFPKLLRVDPGNFLIGSSQNEYDRDSFEGPRYEVTFRKPFALGMFAVTRGQYSKFVMAKGTPMGRCLFGMM